MSTSSVSCVLDRASARVVEHARAAADLSKEQQTGCEATHPASLQLPGFLMGKTLLFDPFSVGGDRCHRWRVSTVTERLPFGSRCCGCVRSFEMLKDERDVLEVLKSELEYLKNGGYSNQESWAPRFIFEDSPTCLDFGHRDNPSPCTGCVLIDFVPTQYRSQRFPCRHIPLDALGQTLDALYRQCDQAEVEKVVCNWLQVTIRRLEQEREAYPHKDERRSFGSLWWRSARCGPESRGIPLYERFHPKCANPACPAAFHWLAGGKFFRFRPEEASSNEDRSKGDVTARHQDVKHYWLCERCSHLFTLVYEGEEGVVLKPRWLGLPMAKTSGERK